MRAVLHHIQDRLDHDLSLDELAGLAHFSRYHFHRIFKGMVGEGVATHVRRLRLERAAFRLIHTDQPVTGVALDARYENHESFTRAFKRAFGCAPTVFRQRHRHAWHVGGASVHYHPDAPAVAWAPSTPPPEPARIAEEPPVDAFVVRWVGPYLDTLPLWADLATWAHGAGLDVATAAAGLCLDDPAITPADKLRYDACLFLPSDFDGKPRDDMTRVTWPGGLHATFRHEGPYEDLVALYEDWLGRWLPRSPYEARDLACLERYDRSPLTDPNAVPVTRVLVPLARRHQPSGRPS